jgi:hypothetical protein
MGARTTVSSFIASVTSSFCPAATFSPTLVTRSITRPGMGAPTSPPRPGVALRCLGPDTFADSSSTRIDRGWPFSSKVTTRAPSASTSPTDISFTISVLPGSMSTHASSPTRRP